MKKHRNKHSSSFKAKVALDAIREDATTAELSRRYKVNANLIYKWKKQLLEQLPQIFERETKDSSDGSERESELLQKIGELTVERDFLSNGLGRNR